MVSEKKAFMYFVMLVYNIDYCLYCKKIDISITQNSIVIDIYRKPAYIYLLAWYVGNFENLKISVIKL